MKQDHQFYIAAPARVLSAEYTSLNAKGWSANLPPDFIRVVKAFGEGSFGSLVLFTPHSLTDETRLPEAPALWQKKIIEFHDDFDQDIAEEVRQILSQLIFLGFAGTRKFLAWDFNRRIWVIYDDDVVEIEQLCESTLEDFLEIAFGEILKNILSEHTSRFWYEGSVFFVPYK
jgi:hypothetical protein